MRLNDFFLNICMRDIANEGAVSICTSLVQKWGSENLENIHTFFETSLEADFDLGGHQNEVGGLFLQNMFEGHTN